MDESQIIATLLQRIEELEKILEQKQSEHVTKYAQKKASEKGISIEEYRATAKRGRPRKNPIPNIEV